jgi:hypothetical protein
MEVGLRGAAGERHQVLAGLAALHAIEAERQHGAGGQRRDELGGSDRELDRRGAGRRVAGGADRQRARPRGVLLLDAGAAAAIDRDVEPVPERADLDLEVAARHRGVGRDEHLDAVLLEQARALDVDRAAGVDLEAGALDLPQHVQAARRPQEADGRRVRGLAAAPVGVEAVGRRAIPDRLDRAVHRRDVGGVDAGGVDAAVLGGGDVVDDEVAHRVEPRRAPLREQAGAVAGDLRRR